METEPTHSDHHTALFLGLCLVGGKDAGAAPWHPQHQKQTEGVWVGVAPCAVVTHSSSYCTPGLALIALLILIALSILTAA